MEKKYNDEDLIEIEKIHKENYKEIHNKAREIFDISSEKNVRSKLLKLLNLVYDKEITCQKDICESIEDIKKSESETRNHNSL